MVTGIDIFKKYFDGYTENFIIIGGTACDIILKEEGLNPRATKDIDLILVVEALSASFVKQFWQFIEDGNYERKEKSEKDRQYYRFVKPGDNAFPIQVEIFSRNPDLLDLEEGSHLTPIPVDHELTSLSAILLDEAYYKYLLANSLIYDGLQLAKTESLICMKARAFLDMLERKESGAKIDERNIRKHKGDVFRLAILLSEDDIFELPTQIKSDMQEFATKIEVTLPDKSIFKNLGLSGVDPEAVFVQLKKSFQLK